LVGPIESEDSADLREVDSFACRRRRVLGRKNEGVVRDKFFERA
jgi:hypothetical protein